MCVFDVCLMCVLLQRVRHKGVRGPASEAQRAAVYDVGAPDDEGSGGSGDESPAMDYGVNSWEVKESPPPPLQPFDEPETLF